VTTKSIEACLVSSKSPLQVYVKRRVDNVPINRAKDIEFPSFNLIENLKSEQKLESLLQRVIGPFGYNY